MFKAIALASWLGFASTAWAQVPAAITDTVTDATTLQDAEPPATTAPDSKSATEATGGSALSVGEQDTLRAAVLAQSAAPVPNTDLDATVGAVAPEGIVLHDLPTSLDAPGFAGLQYVVLTDGRIVFVDPATRTIRAVLD